MSTRPIKAGDLVMVVRANPCCGEMDSIGQVFTATAAERNK